MQEWALFNTILVGIDLFILLYGWYLIKVKRDIARHRRTMIAAGAVFALFLASFLLKIALHGVQPLPVWEESLVQPRHILYVHEGVALVTVPLILAAYWLAFKKDWVRHKKVARWAMPLWIFESAFGVASFIILYHT